MTIGDIDAIEVNEAFASVPLAWLREFDADPAAVNPRGRRDRASDIRSARPVSGC